MKISIVIDNKNSWVYGKIDRLVGKIKEGGHEVKLDSDQNSIEPSTDITFFLSCEDYITKKTRDKSQYNIVIHASDLPKGKGMSPTTWQILEGKDEIPVTLFEVADKIDAGKWYIKDEFKLDGAELKTEWEEKLYQCIEKMALEFVKQAPDIEPKAQTGKESFYDKRTPEDSELDINKSIKEQFDLLRVVDNKRYPAFFRHKGNKYILKIYKEDE